MKNNKTYTKPKIVCTTKTPSTNVVVKTTIQQGGVKNSPIPTIESPPIQESEAVATPSSPNPLDTTTASESFDAPNAHEEPVLTDVPEMSVNDFLAAVKAFQTESTVGRLGNVLSVPLDYNASDVFGKTPTPTPRKMTKTVQPATPTPQPSPTKSTNRNFMDRIVERTSQLLAEKIYNA